MLGLLDRKKHLYKGEIVDLVERARVSEKASFDGVPTVFYDIYVSGSNLTDSNLTGSNLGSNLTGSNLKVGKCDLRLKNDGFMYYYGNVGYNIKETYRGHHYAYYACKILFKIAKEEFGLNELIITCNPDNDASYKTLKRLGGKLVEIAQIPYDHELYEKGDRFKCIFRFKL